MASTAGLLTRLQGVVSRGDFSVPPYPAIALRLRRLLAHDGYGVGEVASVVAADAALAATVLAAANSALLGAGDPVTNLTRAVSRLGARTVGSIALASGIGAAATAHGPLLDVKFRIWRRTMICALTCQTLAKLRGILPEDAFLAGLLHGFGRSVAVSSLEELLKTAPAPEPLPVGQWLGIAEQHRATLAQALAESWKLPQVIAEAVAGRQPSGSALHELVLEADAIAGELEAGGSPEASTPAEAYRLAELLRGLPAALEAFAPVTSDAHEPSLPSPVLAKPEHELTGELRCSTLAVSDRRAKRPAILTCISLAATGIELDCTRPYQECAVVRLLVGDPELGFEAWLTVVLCVPKGAHYRVELQLFSPTRDVLDQWHALYDDARPDETTRSFSSPTRELV